MDMSHIRLNLPAKLSNPIKCRPGEYHRTHIRAGRRIVHCFFEQFYAICLQQPAFCFGYNILTPCLTIPVM